MGKKKIIKDDGRYLSFYTFDQESSYQLPVIESAIILIPQTRTKPPIQMTDLKELQQRFVSIYGTEARIFRAPGRVNLIGEHTDYNNGFVMPVAIDFYTYVAIAARGDRKLTVRSDNFSETIEFDLDDATSLARHNWTDYVRGIA